VGTEYYGLTTPVQYRTAAIVLLLTKTVERGSAPSFSFLLLGNPNLSFFFNLYRCIVSMYIFSFNKEAGMAQSA
jgi:hypothetical protein